MELWRCRACEHMARVDAWDVCERCRNEFTKALHDLSVYHGREATRAQDAAIVFEMTGGMADLARLAHIDMSVHTAIAFRCKGIAVDDVCVR